MPDTDVTSEGIDPLRRQVQIAGPRAGQSTPPDTSQRLAAMSEAGEAGSGPARTAHLTRRQRLALRRVERRQRPLPSGIGDAPSAVRGAAAASHLKLAERDPLVKTYANVVKTPSSPTPPAVTTSVSTSPSSSPGKIVHSVSEHMPEIPSSSPGQIVYRASEHAIETRSSSPGKIVHKVSEHAIERSAKSTPHHHATAASHAPGLVDSSRLLSTQPPTGKGATTEMPDESNETHLAHLQEESTVLSLLASCSSVREAHLTKRQRLTMRRLDQRGRELPILPVTDRGATERRELQRSTPTFPVGEVTAKSNLTRLRKKSAAWGENRGFSIRDFIGEVEEVFATGLAGKAGTWYLPQTPDKFCLQCIRTDAESTSGDVVWANTGVHYVRDASGAFTKLNLMRDLDDTTLAC